jgi:hypothetical protein
MREPRAESGSALILAVILVASLMVLAGAFLAVASIETRIAANEVRAAVAFAVAEGGLEHAVVELGDVDVEELLARGGTLFVGEKLGDGTYTVVVTNNVEPQFPRGGAPKDPGGPERDTDGLLVVTSQGSFETAARAVRALVAREGTIFESTILARDGLTTRAKAVVSGDIVAGGNMSLSPETTVMGSASAGGSINTTENISGVVTVGERPPSYPDLHCPEGDFGPAPGGRGVVFDPLTGDLVVNSGSDLQWPEGPAYFHDFVKSGNGKLVVAEGKKADVVISGSLDVRGAGFASEGETAASVQLWACGGEDRTWSLEQSNESWMTIYAPYRRLELAGEGALHGSLIVGELDWRSDGQMHYDPQIVEDAPFARVPGTWIELRR